MTTATLLITMAENLDALGTVAESAARFATKIIAAAAVLAAIVPKPGQESPLAPIRTLLDYVAFNIGNAKNKDAS